MLAILPHATIVGVVHHRDPRPCRQLNEGRLVLIVPGVGGPSTFRRFDDLLVPVGVERVRGHSAGVATRLQLLGGIVRGTRVDVQTPVAINLVAVKAPTLACLLVNKVHKGIESESIWVLRR